jgi:AsmA family
MEHRGRKILFWLIGIAVAIFVIIAFIPTLLSTSSGTRFLLDRVSKNIPGHLTAKNLDLSWFGKQTIDELTLTDPSGRTVVIVEEITVDRALLPLIWGSTNFGHVTVVEPKVNLVVDSEGNSNLQRAIAQFHLPLRPVMAAITPQLSFTANLPEGTLLVEETLITVSGATTATLRAPELFASHQTKGGPLTVKGAGTIEHDSRRGSFEINLDVERFQNDRILDAFKTAHGKIVATQFPVVIIDQLAPDIQLVKMVGETANLDVQIEPSHLVGKLEAPLLKADVNASPTEATLSASGKYLTLTPTRFTLADQIRLESPTQLTALWNDASITANLERFEMPLDNWRKGTALFTASTQKLEVRPNVVIDTFQLRVDAKQLDQGAIEGKGLVNALPVELEGEFAITKEGAFTLPRVGVDVEGRSFRANFIGSYTAKGQLEFLSPLHIRYDVAPEMISRPELLKKPFQVETFANVKDQKVTGTYTSTDIVLADGALTDVKGSYSVNISKSEATVTLNAKSTADGEKGKVDIKGAFDWKNANISLDASLKPLPVAALMLAAGTPHRAEQIEALLGRRADLEASANLKQMKGPVTLSLNSQNTHANLKGRITGETLTLSAPLNASITITPEIGHYFLSDFNPLLVSAVRGENPVTLRIEPDGFAATRHINGLQIGHASLDLGKLWIKNSGSVRELLGLFKRSQLNEQKEVLVWATPIFFSAKDGALSYQRADMVIGTSIQVAFWGTADLVSNALRMTLAIPGYSLRKVLGLPDVPNDRYLIIPVRGNVDDAKIDYATAVPRIAALLARKEGTTGQIAGALLETAVGSLAGQDKVPPPTTQPYPWANDPAYRFPPATSEPQKPKEALKKEAAKQAGKQLKKLLK